LRSPDEGIRRIIVALEADTLSTPLRIFGGHPLGKGGRATCLRIEQGRRTPTAASPERRADAMRRADGREKSSRHGQIRPRASGWQFRPTVQLAAATDELVARRADSSAMQEGT